MYQTHTKENTEKKINDGQQISSRLTVALISDIHADNDGDRTILASALRNIVKINKNAALIIPGDLADSNAKREQFFNIIEQSVPAKMLSHLLIMLGNHDVRWYKEKDVIDPQTITQYQNRMQKYGLTLYPNTLSVDRWIGGYHFICLNTDKGLKDQMYAANTTQQWLDEKLAEQADENRPIFLMIHQSLNNTHWRAGLHGGLGSQHDVLKTILAKYPQLVLISGHIHNGFGVIEFMQKMFGSLVEVPSLTRGENGIRDKGCGWLMHIETNKLTFEAWNFALDTPLPQYNHALLLPQLSVLTSRLQKEGNSSENQALLKRALDLMNRQYVNDIPDGDYTISGQDKYGIPKIYDENVWQTIEILRQEIEQFLKI